MTDNVIDIASKRPLPDAEITNQTADLMLEGLRMMRILESGDDAAILMAANEIRNERRRLKTPRVSRLAYTHARAIINLTRMNGGLK